MCGDVRSWYAYLGLIFQSPHPIQMFSDHKKVGGKGEWTMLDDKERPPLQSVFGLPTLYNPALSLLNSKTDQMNPLLSR